MINLKNVGLNKDKRQILSNITLDIKEGDFIAVSGTAGAGKTALLKLIGGLLLPTEGELYIDGIEITKYTSRQLVNLRREKFSYVLPDVELDHSLTVEENIELPLIYKSHTSENRKELVLRALTIVGLEEFRGKRITELSAWQKNKLMIAMAISNSPKVIIADEPCKVFDKAKIDEVVGLLKALSKVGITIIVASNLDEYKDAAKRIITLKNGGIVETKKPRKSKESESKPKAKRTRKTKLEKTGNTEGENLKEGEKTE